MECFKCNSPQVISLKSGRKICQSCKAIQPPETKIEESIETSVAIKNHGQSLQNQNTNSLEKSLLKNQLKKILEPPNLIDIEVLAGDLDIGIYKLCLSEGHEGLMAAISRDYRGFLSKTAYVEYHPKLDLRNQIDSLQIYTPGSSKDGSQAAAGGLAGAAVGGLLFGGAGAIVGSIVGSQSSGNIPKINVKVQLKSGQNFLIAVDAPTLYNLEKLASKQYSQQALDQGNEEISYACEFSKIEARRSAAISDGCSTGCGIGCAILLVIAFSGCAALAYGSYKIIDSHNELEFIPIEQSL